MLARDYSFIDLSLLNTASSVNYKQAKVPFFYAEIFEGSLDDYRGTLTGSGVEPASIWNRLYGVHATENFQVGQPRSISIDVPLSDFAQTGHDEFYLDYDYNTGTYTLHQTDYDGSTNSFDVKLGYLIKLNIGYSDNKWSIVGQQDVAASSGTYAANFEASATQVSTKKRFTGIITEIVPDYKANTLTINASDFSQIFINSVNYNFPDITSYRSAPSDSERYQPGSDIEGSTASAVQARQDALWAKSTLANYVPAYDNWKLKDAIRDLCLKAKFPVDMLDIDYNDEENVRLGFAESYPYLRSRTMFDRGADNSLRFVKKYIGIDEEQLNEAKFKFEFGKSLWDCLLSLTEGFGYRVFFDENGHLVIKGIRELQWAGNDFGLKVTVGNYIPILKTTLIENHVWDWSHLPQIGGVPGTIGMIFASAVEDAVTMTGIKLRVISNDTQTSSYTITARMYASAANLVASSVDIIVPALLPYQYAEVDIWQDTALVTLGGIRIIEIDMPAGTSDTFINGLLYSASQDEVPIWSYTGSFDADPSNVSNNINEVRNKMVVIGQPKANQPVVSVSEDSYSTHGGSNRLVSIKQDGTAIDSNAPMDGKFDTDYLWHTASSSGGSLHLPTNEKAKKIIIHLSQRMDMTAGSCTASACFYSDDMRDIGTKTFYDLDDPRLIFTVSDNIYAASGFASALDVIYIFSTVDLRITEIEVFDQDMPVNYVGFKKETVVVKANISDKATGDWMSISQLEKHRRNVKTVGLSIIGNPYLQIGDCITVNTPEIGYSNDTDFWITGIATEISAVDFTMALTLSSLAPLQSYIAPPQIDETDYPEGVYGFGCGIYDIQTRALRSEGTATARTQLECETTLASGVFETETLIKVASSMNFEQYWPTPASATEPAYIVIENEAKTARSMCQVASSIDTVNKIIKITAPGIPYAAGAKVYQYDCLTAFNALEHYILFSFALPKKKKITLQCSWLQDRGNEKQVLAYIQEEKVFNRGVYKRENGIRWDGGVEFQKIYGEQVTKIYLYPNNSYNWLFNRQYNDTSNATWDDPKKQHDMYLISHDKSMWWTKNKWRYTGPMFFLTITTRDPYLLSTKDNASSVNLCIQSTPPTFKLGINDVTPDSIPRGTGAKFVGTFDFYKDEVKQDYNEGIYFNAYVTTSAGANPNGTAEGTSFRWVAPLALNQQIEWDGTDSQGLILAAGKYKFFIQDCFDVFGEGVQVIQTDGNLIDGSLQPKSVTDAAGNTVNSINNWTVKSHLDSANKLITKNTNIWTGLIAIGAGNLWINANTQSTGGQWVDSDYPSGDPYVEFKFDKQKQLSSFYTITNTAVVQNNITTGYEDNIPVSLDMTDLNIPVKQFTDGKYFISFYYKLHDYGTKPASLTYQKIFAPVLRLFIRQANGSVSYTDVETTLSSETADTWLRYYHQFQSLSTDTIVGISINFCALSSTYCDNADANLYKTLTWTLGFAVDSLKIEGYLGSATPQNYTYDKSGRTSEVVEITA